MTKPLNQEPLEALFAEARAGQDTLPDDVFARILADADAVNRARHEPPQTARRGFWAGFGDILGGWPSVAGLATAAVAGIWIGAAQPVGLSDWGLSDWGVPGLDLGDAYELGDLMPGFDALGSEG